VRSHLQNRIHRLLLRALDEGTGIHYDHVGVFGARREFSSGPRQKAHHHFAIDQVLGASQADESDFLWTRMLSAAFLRGAGGFFAGTGDSGVLQGHAVSLF